jgi:lipopolysaccharide assembly protein A
MRAFYALILLIFIAAVAVFAVQNNEEVTLRYLDRSAPLRLSLLVGAAYILGMLSGWTVVGIFRRSLQRVTERPRER